MKESNFIKTPRFCFKNVEFFLGGFTLVEIMIVVAIIALLASIAISNLLRARRAANDVYAQATLKAISTSCETFAIIHSGNYPVVMNDLITTSPPILRVDYTAALTGGYNFTCPTFADTGYICAATPVSCNSSGTRIFTISTGSVIAEVACS